MSTSAVMNRERFAALLEAYGAEPARWPASERATAEALLASDTQAQRLWQEATRLDRLLDGSVAHEPSAALRRAVAEIPLRAPRGVKLPWLLGTFLRGALSATLVLGLGIGFGFVGSAPSDLRAESETGALDAQAQPDGEFDELLTLALADVLDEEKAP